MNKNNPTLSNRADIHIPLLKQANPTGKYFHFKEKIEEFGGWVFFC